MINTLKQGKTHCGRRLITDPVAFVVTDADADFEQNQPSGAESTEMNVSLTSKYGRRVHQRHITLPAILLVCNCASLLN